MAPTCTAVGKAEGRKCSVCHEVLDAGQEIPTLPHTYDMVVTKAVGCTTQGERAFTCSVCTYSYTEAFDAKVYTPTELCEYMSPAVVEILTYDRYGEGLSLGSGFVYSADGMIVTNYHVIEGAHSATGDGGGQRGRG